MSNYPDDCQSNGENLPWNEPEQEVECYNCGKIIDEDECYADRVLCDKCIFDSL